VKKPAAPPDLWDRLDKIEAAAFGGETGDAPPEAFTVSEYSKRRGISLSTAAFRIKRLLHLGELRQGRRLVTVSDGKRRLGNVYWVP
jgi:hypothetical protein